MVDKGTIIQILGGLMKNPSLLAEKDNYSLTPDDFPTKFERIIFVSIYTLFEGGAKKISVVDIDNYLNTNPTSKKVFEHNDGINYLIDVEDYSEVENFPFYYNRLKKLNLLRDLKKMGFDTSRYYDENLSNPKSTEINDRFEELTAQGIMDLVKKDLLGVESEYGSKGMSQSKNAEDGILELIEELKLRPDSGPPLQGHIFNTITKGARKGKYYVRSAASSVGKTRLSLGDACYLAYPMRFNPSNWEWEMVGSNEKTLFITTEQEFDEIQTMILAYLTGFNEEKILYGTYSKEEEKVLKDAIKVMDYFKNNLILAQIPNPNIEKVKSVIRKNILTNEIENVFYDYVFVGPALLGEFRDLRIRNDEASSCI